MYVNADKSDPIDLVSLLKVSDENSFVLKIVDKKNLVYISKLTVHNNYFGHESFDCQCVSFVVAIDGMH